MNKPHQFIEVAPEAVDFVVFDKEEQKHSSRTGFRCEWLLPEDKEAFARFPLILRKPTKRDPKWVLYALEPETKTLAAGLFRNPTKSQAINFLNKRISPVWQSHYRHIFALRILREHPEIAEREPLITALAVSGRLLGLTADSQTKDITQ